MVVVVDVAVLIVAVVVVVVVGVVVDCVVVNWGTLELHRSSASVGAAPEQSATSTANVARVAHIMPRALTLTSTICVAYTLVYLPKNTNGPTS